MKKCNAERLIEDHYEIGYCFLPKRHNGDHQCIHSWTNWENEE